MSTQATLPPETPAEAKSGGGVVLQRLVSEQLPGFEPTDAEWVSEMNLQERVERAIALLKANVPAEGYYVAFSGGKDSCAIKKLCQMSGVKFEARYNQTTIDPPELVRFIKAEHADVKWNLAPTNMMVAVATWAKVPPTRQGRWCCEHFKEFGGDGRVKVMGVRAAESAGRARRWAEVGKDKNCKDTVICPIVLWSDDQLWEFLRAYNVPYCSLYDEGWTRLGCVGCPLGTLDNQKREFKRWPAFERNWKKAIIANWEKYKDVPRLDGKPRYHAKFKTGEDFWQWWLTAKAPDYFREGCQSGLLWTNEPPSAPDVLANADIRQAGPDASK